MRSFQCSMCGYVGKGREAPGVCPVCGADASAFEEVRLTFWSSHRFPGALWWVIHLVGIAGVHWLGVLARGTQ